MLAILHRPHQDFLYPCRRGHIVFIPFKLYFRDNSIKPFRETIL